MQDHHTNSENGEGSNMRSNHSSMRSVDGRNIESRESEARKLPPYRPSSLLDGVPEKEGVVRKWLTTKMLGEEIDCTMKFREGWTPVDPSKYPNHGYPTLEFSGYGSVIMVNGMILCEMPQWRANEINDYHNKRAKRAEASIRKEVVQNVEGLQTIADTERVSGEKSSEEYLDGLRQALDD